MDSLAAPSIMLSLLVIGLLTGAPIAFVIGGVSVISTVVFMDSAFLFTVVSASLSIMNGWILVAVVMFIFMAMVLEKAQIISELFQLSYLWAGRVRGGIAVAVVIASAIFAACTLPSDPPITVKSWE